MKELVVISGKGGTGKTSIVASFAALAPGAVLADCDVDAADLHLVLAPQVQRRETFSGGSQARIRPQACTGCGACANACRFEAIREEGRSDGSARVFRVDPIDCEGCGVCARVCPSSAVEFGPAIHGEWFISHTRFGPMVHAKLGVAAENSGKLVSLVRRHARRIADQDGRDLVMVDGSPGIGCPVIASIGGADAVLIVTEPTRSGLHDLQRVAQLIRHFGIRGCVCVNKWDLNPDMALDIEQWAREHDLPVAGRVRYDVLITDAQVRGLSVVEHRNDGAAGDIRRLWTKVFESVTQGNGKETE